MSGHFSQRASADTTPPSNACLCRTEEVLAAQSQGYRRQQCRHLSHRENRWDAFRCLRSLDVIEPGQVNGQHFTVEEQQFAQRLNVTGRRHPRLVGEHCKKNLHLLLPHVAWMPQSMPFQKHSDSFHIGHLGVQAIVFVMNSFTDLIQ